jgi:alpha-1,6-mannosyltransferase
VALGVASIAVILLASSMRGWPFPTLTAEPWLFQINGTNTALKYSFLALFYVGAAGVCWSWVKLLRLSKAGLITPKQVFGIFLLWSAVLFFATPLFSGDVYVYYVDGQLLQRGFDPYATGISSMGPVPDVHMVHMLWRDTSTMYGPIFIRMVQLIANIAPDNIVVGVMILRAMCIVALFAGGLALADLAKRYGRPVADGLVFALLNPITMLHLVGGAHNDAMMIGLLAVGLAVGLRAKGWPLRLVALALCAAAGAFKIPGFAGAMVLGWVWAGQTATPWRRVFSAGGAAVVALALFEVQTLATGLSWGWMRASDVPGLAHPLLSPPNAVALSFGSLFGVGNELNAITRPLALLISACTATWLIVRTGREMPEGELHVEHVIRAFGWGLLVIAWTGPAVYPWYLGWGIAIVGALGAGKMRKPLIVATIAVIFVIAPGGYGILDIPGGAWRTVIAFATTAIMALAIRHVFKVHGIKPTIPPLRSTRKRLQTLESGNS